LNQSLNDHRHTRWNWKLTKNGSSYQDILASCLANILIHSISLLWKLEHVLNVNDQLFMTSRKLGDDLLTFLNQLNKRCYFFEPIRVIFFYREDNFEKVASDSVKSRQDRRYCCVIALSLQTYRVCYVLFSANIFLVQLIIRFGLSHSL